MNKKNYDDGGFIAKNLSVIEMITPHAHKSNAVT
jgi:hypothetical protein